MLNFAASEVHYLFFLRLAYFSFIFFLILLLRRFRLHDILAPLSAGIALIVFVYGFFQKFYLFPWILGQADWQRSVFSEAFRAKVVSGRIFAIFSLPTLYAAVCGLLLLCIVHYFILSAGWKRIFWGVLFLLGAGNLFLTQSFGGIIFFAVSLLVYLLVSGIFKIKYLAPLLMVVALFFFTVVTMRFSEARELKPAKLRFSNWQQAGRVIASAPLLGVGLGNYETAVPAHILPGEPASIYAHNFFLQAAAETGVPGLFLLLLLAVPWLKNNFAAICRRDHALYVALTVLILFFNLFDVGNYFFAAGIAFAVAFSQLVACPGRPRRGIVWLLLFLAAALLANEVSVDRQRAADIEFARAEDVRAERLYRKALQINPWSYRALLGRAAIAQRKGDQAGAGRIYDQVLAVYPGQAFANFMASQAAFRRGAYLSAMTLARRAAQANKKNKAYQRWHESLKANFADRFSLPGN